MAYAITWQDHARNRGCLQYSPGNTSHWLAVLLAGLIVLSRLDYMGISNEFPPPAVSSRKGPCNHGKSNEFKKDIHANCFRLLLGVQCWCAMQPARTSPSLQLCEPFLVRSRPDVILPRWSYSGCSILEQSSLSEWEFGLGLGEWRIF